VPSRSAPDRPVSTARGRAVAVSPHHLASDAALAVIRRGGSAADGAIAADAVLGVVLPTTCGIGGDLFAIVHRPGMERPDVLNGSGRGGSGLDAEELRAAGHTRMPLYDPHSVTVPGCVDGWFELAGRHGRITVAESLRPAIELATEGFAASPELAAALERIAGRIAGQPSAPALYPHGAPPAPGDRLQRPGLARVLQAIARDGRDGFYRGPVAAAVTDATEGVLTSGDLADNGTDWVEPIGTRVFGLDAWTVPPNSQGYLTLAAAWLLERLDAPADPSHPGFHHAVVEAYRAIAWERDDLVADPDHAPLPPDRLLAADRLQPRLERIRPSSVAPWPEPQADPGGTAYLCVMDGDGVAVSLIQSNFHGIGAGISAGDTGVWLHNRGAGFSLIEGHPNEARPGTRPLHTLSPTLWTKPDRTTAMLLGTRGGHQQPQYLLQMIAALHRASLDPAAAQALPRWSMEHDPATAGSAVAVESRMPEQVVAGLGVIGHAVTPSAPWPPGWGPVSLITADASGALLGAADPRITTAHAAAD
jgi:gamma-glutamyltranspeptidase/glutathione hydrolase